MKIFKKRHLYPIEVISKKKQKFFHTVEKFLLNNLKNSKDIEQTLEYVILSEKRRIENNSFKFDPEDDKEFWSSLEEELKKNRFKKNNLESITSKIVKRYLKEIYSPYYFPYFKLLKIIARIFLSIIYKPFKFFYVGKKDDVLEYANVLGDFDLIESLNEKATLVLVPTHFSHFDSIMAGTAIVRLNEVKNIDIDMPIYAAGFNLYEYKIFKHWISKCGIYEIDRRKKNRIYLETIKTFYKTLILNNCNSLFYPRGTRSRDGSIESSLKYGLLSTPLEAQKFAYKNFKKNAKKIIILPLTINYECVFEAEYLINQYLKKYDINKKNRQKISTLSIIHKIYTILKNSSNVRAVFGRPMDVLGNYVDENAISYDINKNKLDLYELLQSYDCTKEENYDNLKKLESQVLKEYKQNTYIYLSQIIAYAFFEHIRNIHKNKDIKEFWNLDIKNIKTDPRKILPRILELIDLLKNLKDNPILDVRINEFLKNKNIFKYIDTLGAYHDKAPLKKDDNFLTTESLKLLFYYSNKLNNYV